MKHTLVLITLIAMGISLPLKVQGMASRRYGKRMERKYQRQAREKREDDPTIFGGVGVRAPENGNNMGGANLLLGGPVGANFCLGGNGGLYSGYVRNNVQNGITSAKYFVNCLELGGNISWIATPGRDGQVAFHLLVDPELSLLRIKQENDPSRTLQTAGHLDIKPAITYVNTGFKKFDAVTLGVFYNFNLPFNAASRNLDPSLQPSGLNGLEVTAALIPSRHKSRNKNIPGMHALRG